MTDTTTWRLTGHLLVGDTGERAGVAAGGGALERPEAWVHRGRWTFTDPGVEAVTVSGYVLPGLVDVHCHIGLGDQGPVDRETSLAQARADLQAGTLLVRDAGSPADTRWLDGRTDAPRILRAGHHLARPKRYLRYYARELDEVTDLPTAMAEEADRGDGWVKIVGDWIDRARGGDSVLEPLWPTDQLRAGVAAAHERGARVTVHTFETETSAQMLDAGVDCIEHGTGMTAEQIERAAAAAIPVVPTLLQIARFGAIADQGRAKYPRYAEQMRTMHARRYQHVRDLHEAGVPLLLGTDAGGTIPHGLIAAEAAELVQAGVPAADVVAAASWRARDYLGVPGIAEGAIADAVVYADDPRTDIGVLAHPDAVIRAGVRVR
ncbi:amidohydrolase family protein [Ruania zhangjianzhongii]|uniref:amidohydrolase family protein n=1 Tax=Ruania zhangjianzhongii TaxID=2603206 RepID=UPI001F2639B2|nr:amidohydrolase family protein [Ruania zhangjianzhongii]